MVLKQTFKTLGCQSLEFVGTGQEVLDAFKVPGNTYDIVLMARDMLGMDGIETTKRLCQTYSEKNLVILGLTLNLSGSDLYSFEQAGLNDHCLKPFRKEQLQTEIDRCFAEQAVVQR